MVLKRLAASLISRAERRIGVSLDYVHTIAQTDLGLLRRYNRIFGMIDPNRHTPPLAYHAARLRGAAWADCGTCIHAERNLAAKANVTDAEVDALLSQNYQTLPDAVAAVAMLADAVVGAREDNAEARDQVRAAYGEAGLIEVSFAMNGAAFLPGIKRAMGHAQTCDLTAFSKRSA
jgi:alkylhydroperoxidase family enzyme